MKRVLISGFGPFLHNSDNATQKAVPILAKKLEEAGQAITNTIILPTSYKRSFYLLQRRIYRFQPDHVICLGMAASDLSPRIEKYAYNRCNLEIADIDNAKPLHPYITKSGPDHYISSYPITDIAKKLDLRISENAGDYVCNYVFYRLLHYIHKRKPRLSAFFFHIPHQKNITEETYLLLQKAILNLIDSR